MTRRFFGKVLAAGMIRTAKYLYMVEVSAGLKKIVRYALNPDGSVWFANGYVCAVYAR